MPTFILLIVLTNGAVIALDDDYATREACEAAAEALEVPVYTNLLPDSESTRRVGLDAYCVQEG